MIDAVARAVLLHACNIGEVLTLDRLIAGGLTAADARVNDNEALRYACKGDKRRVVCTLAAAGVIEPAARADSRANSPRAGRVRRRRLLV